MVRAHGPAPRGRGSIAIVAAMAAIGWPGSVRAFPPYRSTDAETADPWSLEARLGLLRWAQDGEATAYSSPLLRLNFGLPHGVELISELEHAGGGEGLTDAAVGVKWVPWAGSGTSLGVETLVLLPVSEGTGTGIEANLLTTYRRGALRLHLNLGGFHVEREPEPAEGWRAGVLVEWRLARVRPGFEVFARQVKSDPVEVLAGPGIIIRTRPLDVRLGVHVGLTGAAPDIVTDTWVAGAWSLRRSPPAGSVAAGRA